MVLLQPRLNLKVSQRQILTPGLVQMVSVLALNKLELKDMINTEMVENPVLEELEDSVPLVDDVSRREEERDRAASAATEEAPVAAEEKKDPFEEIDFGSFFQEYLDPGYRSSREMEEIERPSFENFLSKPGNLTDHLMWQLGSLPTSPAVRQAAEIIIGNLNEEGYLIASDEELLGVAPPAPPEAEAAVGEKVIQEAAALGLGAPIADEVSDELGSEEGINDLEPALESGTNGASGVEWVSEETHHPAVGTISLAAAADPSLDPEPAAHKAPPAPAAPKFEPIFNPAELHEALQLIRQMDPPGVACRDLRECLLCQLRFHQEQLEDSKHVNGSADATAQLLQDAAAIVDQHLRAVQNKQYKEIAKAIGRPIEIVQQALEYIRTLDPSSRPALQQCSARG